MCIRDSINAEYMGFANCNMPEYFEKPDKKFYEEHISKLGVKLDQFKVLSSEVASLKLSEQQSSQMTIHFLSLIHISEPTRPLYISYAVFCLKKKKKLQNPTTFLANINIINYNRKE
eukprot:TRINITY_DN28438_c0_g1_i1.p1 TRINITY_DN28438_c0_g1~~TRINITY_DN28438_c0_g1_i1.p1  ORF type:complete len:117 (+),score=34.66 TRINITY_DN28438_c0_g1_i1:150-500(+)